MPKYRKLPPPEVLKVHGVFSLEPGWYKTGKIKYQPTETDTVVKIDKGEAMWYRNGKLHREGGPAIEESSGFRAWYLNDKRHREDGPAVEFRDGTRYWCRNDKVHREDGPAVEESNGTREWFLDGNRLDITTLEELQAEVLRRKGG